MNKYQVSYREIALLETIYRSRDAIRQRDLAKIVGLSLGMTNSILKRLTQKGLLKIRKINNRNVHYIVSPDGVNAIAKKSYRYVKRTIKNVVLYKDAIVTILRDARIQGCKEVILIGKSDIDFIVEHCCYKEKLAFSKGDTIVRSDDDSYFICGEDVDPSACIEGLDKERNVVYLRELLLKRTG